jgi:protein SCO1/2
MSRRSKIFIVAAVAGLAVGIWWARENGPPEIAGFVYPEPRELSPFTLLAHDGTQFTLDRLRGKWTFAYFGYTYCPDVCPTTLAELARVQSLLAAAGLDDTNQYLLISVDPKRDTRQHLARYVSHFNRKLVGLTGARAALDRLIQEVGVAYDFPEGTDGDNYPVSHSSIVALFDPDARLHAVFTAPHKAEAIADGFRKLRARRRASVVARK